MSDKYYMCDTIIPHECYMCDTIIPHEFNIDTLLSTFWRFHNISF